MGNWFVCAWSILGIVPGDQRIFPERCYVKSINAKVLKITLTETYLLGNKILKKNMEIKWKSIEDFQNVNRAAKESFSR